MKKYLALIVGMVVVFAFAATSFADVTLSGEIKQWNWWRDNMDGFSLSGNLPAATPNQAFSMTRVRLNAAIKVSDNVMGDVELETMAGPSGGTSDFYTWGSLNSKQSTMNLRQAWILYTGSGLLGVPAGLKTGHMPLVLGLGKFFNNTRYGDDAIVFFVDPNKQLHIGVLTFKVNEGSFPSGPSNAQDIDVYAGLVVYKIDDNSNVGVNYVRINDPETVAGLREFQNLMAHTQLTFSNLTLRAEGDIQFGKLTKNVPGGDIKATGYLAYVDAAYKVDPATIRAAAAYGSGDKDDNDTKFGNFINFLGPDMNVAFIYEYQIATAAGGGNTSGLTNTTMFNLGVDFSATKEFSLALDGYLFRANKTTATATGSGTASSKKVGTEFDLKAKYDVSKGLAWTILAGVFSPGKFYEDAYLTPLGLSKKTATAVRSDLTLSF